MQPEKNLKPAGSPKPSTVAPRVVKLTPEQELKARLQMEQEDKEWAEMFKNGVDLSGQETR